jgi:hypothetical protein
LKSVSPQPDYTKPRNPFPSSRTTSYGELSHLRRPSRPFAFENQPALTLNIPPEDDDDRDFQSPSRANSPRNTIADALSISASTTTAGPSVNMIEKMSATVRRLETDLAATKEEITRSIKQRDEARDECVKLMTEVDQKRQFQTSVGKLQEKYDILDNRYFPQYKTNGDIMKLWYSWVKNRNV